MGPVRPQKNGVVSTKPAGKISVHLATKMTQTNYIVADCALDDLISRLNEKSGCCHVSGSQRIKQVAAQRRASGFHRDPLRQSLTDSNPDTQEKNLAECDKCFHDQKPVRH